MKIFPDLMDILRELKRIAKKFVELLMLSEKERVIPWAGNGIKNLHLYI